MSPEIEQEFRARLIALEHAVVCAFSALANNDALRFGGPCGPRTDEIAEGLVSTFADAMCSAELKQAVLTELRLMGAQIAANGRTFDELQGR